MLEIFTLIYWLWAFWKYRPSIVVTAELRFKRTKRFVFCRKLSRFVGSVVLKRFILKYLSYPIFIVIYSKTEQRSDNDCGAKRFLQIPLLNTFYDILRMVRIKTLTVRIERINVMQWRNYTFWCQGQICFWGKKGRYGIF